MILFNDKIKVIRKSHNATFGNETDGKEYVSKAYIQDDNSVSYTVDGKNISSNMRIFVPSDLNVQRGDSIVFLEDSVHYFNDDREWEVRYVNRVGGLRMHHKEVIV